MQDSLSVRCYSLSDGFSTRLGGAAAFPALWQSPGFRLLFCRFVSVICFFLVSAFGAFPAAMPLHGAMRLEVSGNIDALERRHSCRPSGT